MLFVFTLFTLQSIVKNRIYYRYKLGRGVGGYIWLYFLFTGMWAYNWGSYKWGWDGGSF